MSLSRKVNTYNPTFQNLVSDSFHTYRKAYESLVGVNSNLFSIGTNVLFHSYVKLCTTIGGVFNFQTTDEGVVIGFLPFTKVDGLMIGGGRYSDTEIVHKPTPPSILKKFKKYVYTKQINHYNSYYLFSLITSCIFYLIMALSCINLISWAGAGAFVGSQVGVIKREFSLIDSQINAPIGPYEKDFYERLKELTERMNNQPVDEEIPMTSELSVRGFPSFNVLLEEIKMTGTGTELGFVVPPASPSANKSDVVAIKKHDNVIGIVLGDVVEVYEKFTSISNIIEDAKTRGMNKLLSIGEKTNKIKILSLALSEKMQHFEEKKDKFNEDRIYSTMEAVGNTLTSATEYLYQTFTFQERKSPLEDHIETLTQMKGLLSVIGPTIVELSQQTTIINNGLSVLSNTMWLGIQIKFLMFTWMSISSYFSYKLIKSLNANKKTREINRDYYKLSIMDKGTIPVFKKIANGKEITEREIKGFLKSILDEKKGDFSAYAGLKLNINFNSLEDKLFLEMANMASNISKECIDQGFLNYIITQYELFIKLNPESSESSMYIEGPSQHSLMSSSHISENPASYGGTKRKTKNPRKTRKGRKTRKERKPRKWSKRITRKH